MIALLIILYLLIGLTVGTIIHWKENESYSFKGSIKRMEIDDFWMISIIGAIWPIVLIIIGLPALFKFIILSVIKLIEEKKDEV